MGRETKNPNETESGRVCRRCLIKDLPDALYYQSIYDYIDRLEEEIKTPTETYERRLSLCMECENLLNGMCRICGCFVEMRAAVSKNCCPAVQKKW